MHELTWTTPDGDEWPMQVMAPVEDASGEGWPIVVTFHGARTGTSASDLSSVAQTGIVVAAPRWIEPEWSMMNLSVLDPGDYVDGMYFDDSMCAYAAAQAAAVELGGDAGRTTVEGFSAGVHPAAWVALGLERENPCPDADSVPPIALALGDAQFLFEGVMGSTNWDPAFADPASIAQDTLDRLLNPERWNADEDLRILIWSSNSTAADRAIESPPSADSWIRQRGDDQLIADLDELGQFDDGVIGFTDTGNLFSFRAENAGWDVTLGAVDGEHTRSSTELAWLTSLAWGEDIDLE